MESSDGEIIERVLGGEPQRFDVLVERHGKALLGWLSRRCAGPEEARECFQETWVRAYEGLGRLDDPLRLRAWLLGIAFHLVGKRRRSKATQGLEPLGERDLPAAEGRDPLEQRELSGRIHAAVQRLPERQREVFELRALVGLDHASVAERLGIREDNARANYHQAVRKLRAELGDELT